MVEALADEHEQSTEAVPGPRARRNRTRSCRPRRWSRRWSPRPACATGGSPGSASGWPTPCSAAPGTARSTGRQPGDLEARRSAATCSGGRPPWPAGRDRADRPRPRPRRRGPADSASGRQPVPRDHHGRLVRARAGTSGSRGRARPTPPTSPSPARSPARSRSRLDAQRSAPRRRRPSPSAAGLRAPGASACRRTLQQQRARLGGHAFGASRAYRAEGFNRITIRVEPGKLRVLVNGHLFYEDADPEPDQPLARPLAAEGRTAFRNLELTGRPEIPREVRLTHADRLDGWAGAAYDETTPPGPPTAPTTGPAPGQPRTTSTGTRATARSSAGDSTSRRLEPSTSRAGWPTSARSLDGESISYEFLYEPGQTMAHPALGRLAFLIEPDGVQLHWMTDGPGPTPPAWRPTTPSTSPEPPGPGPLPLKPGDWNRATLALDGGDRSRSTSTASGVFEHPIGAGRRPDLRLLPRQGPDRRRRSATSSSGATGRPSPGRRPPGPPRPEPTRPTAGPGHALIGERFCVLAAGAVLRGPQARRPTGDTRPSPPGSCPAPTTRRSGSRATSPRPTRPRPMADRRRPRPPAGPGSSPAASPSARRSTWSRSPAPRQARRAGRPGREGPAATAGRPAGGSSPCCDDPAGPGQGRRGGRGLRRAQGRWPTIDRGRRPRLDALARAGRRLAGARRPEPSGRRPWRPCSTSDRRPAREAPRRDGAGLVRHVRAGPARSAEPGPRAALGDRPKVPGWAPVPVGRRRDRPGPGLPAADLDLGRGPGPTTRARRATISPDLADPGRLRGRLRADLVRLAGDPALLRRRRGRPPVRPQGALPSATTAGRLARTSTIDPPLDDQGRTGYAFKLAVKEGRTGRSSRAGWSTSGRPRRAPTPGWRSSARASSAAARNLRITGKPVIPDWLRALARPT